MDVVEPIRRLAEASVGIPSREEALDCVRLSRPARLKFRDDGYVPNNPKFPLLFYQRVLRFARRHDPAAVLEKTFVINGWGMLGAMAFTTSCTTTL